MLVNDLQQAERAIVHRSRGRTHGPITRLVSPSGAGERIKPFVFLDRVVLDGGAREQSLGFGWHPHSGIATVTVILDGSIQFAETTGREGALPTGGVEWMRAGNGVWHAGDVDPGAFKGFQLWVALPPELENAPSASEYLLPEDVPQDGPVRVILGAYGGLQSQIDAPPMTYLVVTLSDGERWTYQPPESHDVAWIAVMDGAARTPSMVAEGELAVFEPGERHIDFVAEGDTRFVLGSAPRHAHDLVLGSYSVHTNPEALRQGEAEIQRIGRMLMANGTI